MEEKGNYVTISGGGRHNATIKVFMVNASQQWFRWTICRGVYPDDKSHVEGTETHTVVPKTHYLEVQITALRVHCVVKAIEGQGTTIDVVLVNEMPHEGHQIVVHSNLYYMKCCDVHTVLASSRHNNFKSDFEEKGWTERVGIC
ncbi:hypothetical protein C5167_007554 [Papaver somniferum]|nr:hypothetical protein C5167_007554 [Papaver somniferum]